MAEKMVEEKSDQKRQRIMLQIGEWYKSKRGHLCLIERMKKNRYGDEVVVATSHSTGNLIEIGIDSGQLEHFVGPVPAPDTLPGTAIFGSGETKENGEVLGKYTHIYTKYPHVIPDSIYKVKNVGNKKEDEEIVWVNGKPRAKKQKMSIKGAVRCEIQCQIPGCKNTRDIKIQDCFQVKFCVECKGTKRKKELKKFLESKKDEPKPAKKPRKKK